MDYSERLLIEVRRPDLTRWNAIEHADINGLSLVPRHNKLGAWSLALAADSPAADVLRLPGWGLIATLDQKVLLSGPQGVNPTLTRSQDDPVGTWQLGGYTDDIILSDLLAYPSPATADVTVQVGTGGSGYDERTGHAGSVLRAIVNANAGPGAPSARRVPLLTISPDLAEGSVVDGTGTNGGRFQKSGEWMNTLAAAGGVGHRVRQSGGVYLFEIYVPRDLSRKIRFDLANGTMDELTYSYGPPVATRVIVGGDGTDADRILREVTTPESLAAEALWKRRSEAFLDSSSADDDVLEQAGIDYLTENGRTTVAVTFTPVDTDEVQFLRDYYLGDTVTCVVDPVIFPPAGEIPAVVVEAQITYGADGFSAKAVIGDPTAAVTDPLLVALRNQRALTQRVSRIERR